MSCIKYITELLVSDKVLENWVEQKRVLPINKTFILNNINGSMCYSENSFQRGAWNFYLTSDLITSCVKLNKQFVYKKVPFYKKWK